jgi:3-keto-5-aminohexanoate cleavage enzyme
VRVGLEDNIWFDRDRTIPASNPDLVARIARVAEFAERPLASPAEARRLLGLTVPAEAAEPRSDDDAPVA